jgi:hypothetical protein
MEEVCKKMGGSGELDCKSDGWCTCTWKTANAAGKPLFANQIGATRADDTRRKTRRNLTIQRGGGEDKIVEQSLGRQVRKKGKKKKAKNNGNSSRIYGIEGEATATGHENWIQVDSRSTDAGLMENLNRSRTFKGKESKARVKRSLPGTANSQVKRGRTLPKNKTVIAQEDPKSPQLRMIRMTARARD